MSTAADKQQALIEWTELLGDEAVITESAQLERYTASTLGIRLPVLAAVRPRDASQVAAIVGIAREHRLPLYPISCGRNWGYASSSPIRDDAVILDLSYLNRILSFDETLGLATVEPGVTTQQLFDYIHQRRLPFLAPVHGGGPTCSVLGNALERGYGLTPYCDHFGALTALKAVLADGTTYQSPLLGLGVPESRLGFKWGIGPYLDGLFTQSNYGIVTQGTFALSYSSGDVDAFLCEFSDDASLEKAVELTQRLLRELPGIIWGINIIDSLRHLAMKVPYPAGIPSNEAISVGEAARLARQHKCPPWISIGAIYGSDAVRRTARRLVKRIARGYPARVTVLEKWHIRYAKPLVWLLPLRQRTALNKRLEMASSFLDIAAGKPNQIALHLAYWRKDAPPIPSGTLDPARDGCGLIWYTPLIPMLPEAVREYVEMVRTTCRTHKIDPLITLTSFSDRCFDSSIPLLFDPNDAALCDRARDCYRELFAKGKAQGFLPYRIGMQAMASVFCDDGPTWKLQNTIKRALDPSGIIAPGRYSAI